MFWSVIEVQLRINSQRHSNNPKVTLSVSLHTFSLEFWDFTLEDFDQQICTRKMNFVWLLEENATEEMVHLKVFDYMFCGLTRVKWTQILKKYFFLNLISAL